MISAVPLTWSPASFAESLTVRGLPNSTFTVPSATVLPLSVPSATVLPLSPPQPAPNKTETTPTTNANPSARLRLLIASPF
jgi:hypothetical protein